MSPVPHNLVLSQQFSYIIDYDNMTYAREIIGRWGHILGFIFFKDDGALLNQSPQGIDNIDSELWNFALKKVSKDLCFILGSKFDTTAYLF